MDHSFLFRRRLAARLTGVALLGLVAAPAGCGETSSGPGYQQGYNRDECFPWPQASSGSSGGALSTGGTGGTTTGGTGGTTGGTGGTTGGMGGMTTGGTGGAGGTAATGGQGGAPAVVCPSTSEAPKYMSGGTLSCGESIELEGVFSDGQCCYTLYVESCGVGRPFVVEGRARAARLRAGATAWPDSAAPRPDVSDLSDEERRLLAEAWLRDGLLEHASIASFGRFALELLAMGAPPALLRGAHEAALDEVRHARLAFALASAYAGATVGPDAFPFAGGGVAVSADPAEIAVRVVQEGCIAETLASVVAAEQASRAADPAVRAVLMAIAEDEARHAELAWATITWMLRVGDGVTRQAIMAAFTEALSADPPLTPADGGPGKLEAHGRPEAGVLRGAMQRALLDVIQPAFEQLRSGTTAPGARVQRG